MRASGTENGRTNRRVRCRWKICLRFRTLRLLCRWKICLRSRTLRLLCRWKICLQSRTLRLLSIRCRRFLIRALRRSCKVLHIFSHKVERILPCAGSVMGKLSTNFYRQTVLSGDKNELPLDDRIQFLASFSGNGCGVATLKTRTSSRPFRASRARA